MDFPGGSDTKESACKVGDLGLIPGLGRYPGGGHGNTLQYSCWRIPRDRGTWQFTDHRVAKSQTRLNEQAHFPLYHCRFFFLSIPHHSMLIPMSFSVKVVHLQ